jgi:heterodisulfide reductase subunit C
VTLPQKNLNAQEKTERVTEQAQTAFEHALDALNVCYQCGVCTGGCPVARMAPEYNIRRIVKAARERRVQPDDGTIWLCSTCYTCYERCPQDIKPIHAVHTLTNMASQKGCIPMPVKKGNRNILAMGRIVEVSAMVHKKRKVQGLPELKTDVSEDYKRIAEHTGMEKMLK